MNFIEEKIDNKIKENPKYVPTFRFPPEPNSKAGIHLGHVKSIVLNFGLAEKYNSTCILRFDDTNPTKEKTEYVNSIISDINWLGYTPYKITYASDYFNAMCGVVTSLISTGYAYIDFSTSEEIANMKGNLTTSGLNSPYRDTDPSENFEIFQKMRSGEITNAVVRAKIDMGSHNMLLRDPVIYRCIDTPHHRTGDIWKVYPMYDFAHPLCDIFEKITDSLCTLEFEVHRPMYNWVLENTYHKLPSPEQTEFNRLNINYNVLSKRFINEMVDNGVINGIDDPRLLTIKSLRRRGYTPSILKAFCEKVGWTKNNSTSDYALLEACAREEFNKTSDRYMTVIDPIKLTITNWGEDVIDWFTIENNPEDSETGERTIPFTTMLYIEREDFKEDANRKFFRLKIGGEVRLKGAYVVKAYDCIKDDNGEIIEVLCTVDPNSKSGMELDRKIKGTIHWVSRNHAVDCEIREYDRLFNEEKPNTDNILESVNKNSLSIKNGYSEINSLKLLGKFNTVQFMRKGYYIIDKDSTESKLVFNRCVTLKETWNK